MQNRWFHIPRLHTELHGDKKVSWLELFYDLIFAASIIQLGDALSDAVSRGEGLLAFAKFAGHFVPLWIAWTGFTFFANRFTVDDFVHRGLVFVQMFAIGAMAIASPLAMAADPQPIPFSIAYAVAQAIVALMYLRAYRQVPEAAEYSRYWGLVFGVGALVWVGAVFVPLPWCYLLWAVGVAAILYSPISAQSRTLTERFPIDMEHLSERYGLLTIIVLGESFVKVLSYLASSEHGIEPEYLLKGCFNLLITCCVWWIYFDDVAGSRVRKGRGSWIVWLYGHLPLAVGVTGVGVAVKMALKFDLNAAPDPKAHWFLAGTLALTFLAVAIIDSVTERRQAELSDRWRVNVRVVSGLLLLVMGQVGSNMSSRVYLAIIAAVCAGQLLFDMVSAPLMEQGELATTAIAEIAKQRAGEARPTERRIRRDISEAVRKGAPAELRRDLYFFFMEGSWTRMIVALIFCYLLINVLFAGLYLLEPASIGAQGTGGFARAFAFSVQTMSTIGYGTISPQTPYADLVVTIEAAVGLLGVALATGLMFAKASLPRSSVLFSKNMVVTTMHGKRVLSFRLGNARGNDVVDASVSVTVLVEDISPEGHHLRRVRDLNLVRSRSPVFTLSWTVMHEIDEQSPLHGMDWSAPRQDIVAFIITMLGHDSTYGQTTHARHIYDIEDVKANHRFVDVISEVEDGRMMIDYTRFHDTEPE